MVLLTIQIKPIRHFTHILPVPLLSQNEWHKETESAAAVFGGLIVEMSCLPFFLLKDSSHVI